MAFPICSGQCAMDGAEESKLNNFNYGVRNAAKVELRIIGERREIGR